MPPTNVNITTYGPLFTRLDTANQTAANLRLVQSSETYRRGGVLGGGDFAVTAGSGLTINVAAGTAYVPGTGTNQGLYKQTMVSTAVPVLSTNNPGAARTDRVLLIVEDTDFTSGTLMTLDTASIYIVQGTPGGGVPAIPTTVKAYLELAQVNFGVNATTTGTVVDKRIFASPNNYQVLSSTTRPVVGTSPTPYRGRTIFETDTAYQLTYYGATTGWKLPWNVPWGYQATVSGTSAGGFNNTVSQTVDSSATFAFVTGRRYCLDIQLEVLNNAAGGTVDTFVGSVITATGTYDNQTFARYTPQTGVSGQEYMSGMIIYSCTGGAAGKVRVVASTSLSGTSQAMPSTIARITDVGPASTAPGA